MRSRIPPRAGAGRRLENQTTHEKRSPHKAPPWQPDNCRRNWAHCARQPKGTPQPQATKPPLPVSVEAADNAALLEVNVARRPVAALQQLWTAQMIKATMQPQQRASAAGDQIRSTAVN